MNKNLTINIILLSVIGSYCSPGSTEAYSAEKLAAWFTGLPSDRATNPTFQINVSKTTLYVHGSTSVIGLRICEDVALGISDNLRRIASKYQVDIDMQDKKLKVTIAPGTSADKFASIISEIISPFDKCNGMVDESWTIIKEVSDPDDKWTVL